MNVVYPGCSQAEFSSGVNLAGWFQTGSPGQIQFGRFGETDFDHIKSLGCDVIRLPINLHTMTTGAPEYEPDPLFLNLLDRVVEYAQDRQLYLILDNHTFDPAVNTEAPVEDILIKVWKQMAVHYKDYSRFLLFEVLNEPDGLTDET